MIQFERRWGFGWCLTGGGGCFWWRIVVLVEMLMVVGGGRWCDTDRDPLEEPPGDIIPKPDPTKSG
ncbi:hypothetical protein HanIR_Chr13g0666411 [Helianthus annuus]|nr:hypothetical protein HanIR_Chr13g0666411 [Helianthus annuus]